MPEVAYRCGALAQGNKDTARSFIDAHVPTGSQRHLLCCLLDHFPEGENSPYTNIPLLVYSAITGREEPALPLATLGTFLFLGLDIIDDIADGDAGDHWPGHSHSELQLGSALFLSALPQILLANLNPPEEIRSKIERRFADGLLEIAAGQQMELGMTGKSDICPQEVEDSMRAKSSGIATLASLAALLAGARQAQISQYEEIGCNLGSALQLATDFYDLFQAPLSRDLRNGTRTLPIALALEQCPQAEKWGVLKLLDEVRSDRFKQEEIRKWFLARGIGHFTAFIIELYCERARKSLNLAKPHNSYKAKFISYIDKTSLFGG